MNAQTVRVLLIEDDPDEAHLIVEMLSRETALPFEAERATTLQAGLARLAEGDIDVVLLDLALPDHQGLETLRRVHAQAPTVPLLVLTVTDDEALALEAVRHGAQGYLVKTEISGKRLLRAIYYAIEHKRMEQVLREREKQLQQANKRLEEAAAVKDEVVTKVSHELRTPLTSIKMGITLLLNGALGSINGEQGEFLGMVNDSIDRLTELVSNLLDLSKSEAGRLRLIRRRLDIRRLIETTINSYKAVAGQRTLKADLVPVPEIFGDSNRILQVLGNLFSNAVKFTQEKGMIAFACWEQDGHVVVSVQDDGIGIATDDLPKLFQKFSQVGEGAHKSGGTGLGLAVCKELVDLHKGTLSVVSEQGRGSTFTFTVPIYTPQFALQESLEEKLELASQTQEETVGLVVLDTKPLFGSPPDVPPQDRDERLKQLMEPVRKNVHQGDTVLFLEPQWVVILAVTDAVGVKAIVRRLRKILSEHLAGGEGTRINFGAAIHPADGREAQRLFATATGSLNHGLAALEEAEQPTEADPTTEVVG